MNDINGIAAKLFQSSDPTLIKDSFRLTPPPAPLESKVKLAPLCAPARAETTKDHHHSLGTSSTIESTVTTLNTERLVDRADTGDILEYIPKNIRRRVGALRQIHDERLHIMEQYRMELKSLDAKYAIQYQPLYDQRHAIVIGSIEPSASTSFFGDEMYAENLMEDFAYPDHAKAVIATAEAESLHICGIPHFWTTVLQNHELISPLITELDTQALDYVCNICSYENLNADGFTIEFSFKENPFFSNTTLVKAYEVERHVAGEMILKKSSGSTIEWRAPTSPLMDDAASFFTFFSPVNMDALDEQSDTYGRNMSMLDVDFQVGYAIHDAILPDAILWYTGEADYANSEATASSHQSDEDEDFFDQDDDSGECHESDYELDMPLETMHI